MLLVKKAGRYVFQTYHTGAVQKLLTRRGISYYTGCSRRIDFPALWAKNARQRQVRAAGFLFSQTSIKEDAMNHKLLVLLMVLVALMLLPASVAAEGPEDKVAQSGSGILCRAERIRRDLCRLAGVPPECKRMLHRCDILTRSFRNTRHSVGRVPL